MRKQIAVLVLLMGVRGVALASPGVVCLQNGNTVSPACISLVGTAGGVPAHSFGQFQVVVRDVANNPCPGATVVVDLSACPDLHLCADQRDPDAIVNCATKTVRKLTAADGTVRFTLLGGSSGTGNAVELLAAGKIYANGTLIGSPTVSAYDLDGTGGVTINDLSVWITDFGTFGNPAFGRSDFDCSGGVGINDMSVWLSAFGSGAQIESCGATCP
jgi:hypothetical protein